MKRLQARSWSSIWLLLKWVNGLLLEDGEILGGGTEVCDFQLVDETHHGHVTLWFEWRAVVENDAGSD